MPRNFAIRLRCPRGDSGLLGHRCEPRGILRTDPPADLGLQVPRTRPPERNSPGSHGGSTPRRSSAPRKIRRRLLALPFPATPVKKNSPLRRAHLHARSCRNLRFCWQSRRLPRRYPDGRRQSQRRPRLSKNQTRIGRTPFFSSTRAAAKSRKSVSFISTPTPTTKLASVLAFKKPISDFWKKSRKKARIPKTFRVIVKGTDPNGHPFAQSAYTVDLSQEGARLDGIGFPDQPRPDHRSPPPLAQSPFPCRLDRAGRLHRIQSSRRFPPAI